MENKKWGNYFDGNKTDFDSSILPMAMSVSSRIIGMDLVSVVPLGGFATDEIKSDIIAINRDNKIDNIVEGKEYKEMKPEEHPDYYKGGPRPDIFYLDYSYGLSQSI